LLCLIKYCRRISQPATGQSHIESMKPDFHQYLYQQRAKNSAEHALIRFIAQIGQATITTALLWNLVAHYSLITWFIASTTLAACMFFLQRALAPENPLYTWQRWSFVNIACSSTIGFSWSLAPTIFFIPGNTLFIVLMVALYAGYVSGSLAVNFTYKHSFIGFTIGITTPFVIRLLYEGGTLHTTLAGLILFYVAMLCTVSVNMHKLFIKSIEVEYTNNLLIKELAKEKKIVEQAVTSKNKFLAAASHDLRQPLNAISLFTDALKPLQSHSQGSEILTQIRQSLTGLNGMLHGLLDISRLDADVIENNPKHVLLKTVVEQLQEEYRHNTKKIAITTNIDDDTIVYIDSNQSLFNMYRCISSN